MAGGEGTRAVLTVLFTDIVGSTAMAAELGDAVWGQLLDAHDAMVRERLKAYRGKEVKTVGDGFVATFASPTAAVGCARSIIEGANEIGIRVRAGLHTGEVELRGRDLGGIGVHIAARVADLAGADEVLVSATVKDICDGSGVTFSTRGTHALRGVPGRRSIFLVGEETAPRPTRKRRPNSQTPPSVSVLVADDHPLWRRTLRSLLDGMPGITVVAEASNGAEAVEAASRGGVDVAVLDIDMPQLDGIEAARRIADAGVAKVLMLSSLKERDEVLAAVRAGACGYLLKTAEVEEVAEAVRRVHAGEMAFPAELTSLVLAELRSGLSPGDAAPAPGSGQARSRGPTTLSEREREVLDLMAQGRSNQAIARELHMAPKTLETHVASIFSKLGLEPAPDHHRRVQAVVAHLRGAGTQG